jgi:subtilisin family serine protease
MLRRAGATGVLELAAVTACCIGPLIAIAQTSANSTRQFVRLPSTQSATSGTQSTSSAHSPTQAMNPAVPLPTLSPPPPAPTATVAPAPKPLAKPAPIQSPNIAPVPSAATELPAMAPIHPPAPSGRPSPSGMPGVVSGGSAPELPPMVARGAAAADQVEQGQLLAAWPDEAQAQQGLAFLKAQYGLDPTATASFANVGVTIALFQLPRHQEAIRLKEELARTQPGWTVDFNGLLYTMAEPRHYALAQIGHSPSAAGRAVGARIGLLDTDIEEIPALDDVRITIQDFVGPQDGPDSRAHGTAIASLLVGLDEKHGFRPVARGAELMAAAIVMRRNGRGVTNVGLVMSGLDWLLGQQVQVINISLGGPDNAVMAMAIEAIARRSVLIVAAAGNDGPKGQPLYPAAYANVIAATAVDARERVFQRASRGPHVMIAAPGVDLWVPDAAQGRYVSGTSFAAAHVTGALALLRVAEPRARPAELKERLCGTAKNLGEPGRDPVFGCGLLQVARALRL